MWEKLGGEAELVEIDAAAGGGDIVVALGLDQAEVVDARRWSGVGGGVGPGGGVSVAADVLRDSGTHRPALDADVDAARCRRERIEPPSAGRVDRIVASARRRCDERFARTTLGRVPPRAREGLAALLDDNESGRSRLWAIRSQPAAIGVEVMLGEIDKLRLLREIGLPDDLFASVPASVVSECSERAAPEMPSAMAAHPEHVRVTLLAALCWTRRGEITDNLVDLLIALVHKIGAKAERRVETEFVAELRRVSGKTNLLFKMAEAAIEHPDGIVSEVLYPVVGEQRLRDLVREYKSSGPAYRKTVKTYLRASYGNHYRRAIPPLLDALEFRSSNTAHRPVLDALDLIGRYVERNEHTYGVGENVPLEIVPAGWREFVVSIDTKGRERVNRIAFEVCTLQALS